MEKSNQAGELMPLPKNSSATDNAAFPQLTWPSGVILPPNSVSYYACPHVRPPLTSHRQPLTALTPTHLTNTGWSKKILTYLPYPGRANFQFPWTGYLLTYKMSTTNMDIHQMQSSNQQMH